MSYNKFYTVMFENDKSKDRMYEFIDNNMNHDIKDKKDYLNKIKKYIGQLKNKQDTLGKKEKQLFDLSL